MSVAVISAEFRTGVGNTVLRQHPPAFVNSRAAPPLALFDAAVRVPEYIGAAFTHSSSKYGNSTTIEPAFERIFGSPASLT